MCMVKLNINALFVASSTSSMAMAAPQDGGKGFVDGSTLSNLSRLQYINRDFKDAFSNPANGGRN